jgi:hypothetical protein
VVNTAAQLAQIINKLLQKTISGQQKWTPSVMANKYQARFGDFAVEISGQPGIGTNYLSTLSSASIKVTKLDGSRVAEAGGTQSALSTLSGQDALDGTAQSNLNRLYSLVSDRSSDLDELLKLI